MSIFSQTKIHFLSRIATLLLVLLSFSPIASACNLFDWTDCETTTSVNYCNSNDPASAKYCSLDRGTQVVSGNINSIEKDRKFSVYIQDIIAYLLIFLGIVGVIYIIYAGFNILTAAGDDDKVKKSKTTIFHVFIGLLLIFLAYSIVKFVIGVGGTGGILNNAFRLPSIIETTYAYTEYDTNTFDNYKKQIELLSSTLDREYQVQNKITEKTLSSLNSLVRGSMETFPDSDNLVYNTNIANSLITAIELVKKTPDSDTNIANLAKNINDYLTKVKVNRIKGKIIASPETGNAPLTVTLRASEVVDPSGVTIPKGSYIWWIRAPGGARTILGTGPSIAYTFQEERTYTVFLNILSSSRNKNGKTDVLPFDASINIHVLPRLGNISLAINGVYVSHLDKIKFTPAQGRQGLLIDPTASTSAAGTKFISTRFDYGNGNIAQYNNAPSMDRQIYSNEGNYKLRMEVVTNENQKVVKELDIEIRDPISSIKTDKTNGFANDEFRFNASSSAAMLNLGYSWQITELDSEKSIFTSSLQNITYKFQRTGKYAVKLKTLASNGKDDYDTVIVTIEGRDPVVSFDTKILNSESPNTLLLDATKSYDPDNRDGGNLTYAWIIDGVRSDLSNSSRNGALGRYTFDTVGTHRITLEVSNKEGKTLSYDKDVNITSLLAIRLMTTPKIVKAGSSISLIADSKEAQTFEWQFGDGENDTSTTGRMNHVYRKSGTYSVNVTVRGRNSDSNSITRKVYVTDSTHPFAIITLKRDNEEIIPEIDACEGKEAFVIDRSKAVTMSADSSVNIDGTNQGIAYTWKYGNRSSSQKDFSYKFDELGCFPISLTVRSQKTGAQDTMRAYVKVENLAPKLSSLTVSTDKIDADPVTVTVTANNATDDDGVITSYIWYYYTAEDPEPQDFRITRSPKTVFVLPRIGAKYYFAVILEDSNGLKISSDEMSTERYSLTLASDNINTPIITLKASDTNISVDQKIDFSVSAKNILGTDLADKAEYKWDYNGDGFYEETTNTPTVSHVYDKPGNFNFKVKVTYKGISNTKYQAITVKNEIVPNLEYIAIGKKFIFLNTTKGLYTKVKWSLADVISNTPDSFVYDFGENPITDELILEVSDGKDTKSIATSIKKDVVNALKTKKSSDKLIYFSYPVADDGVVHIQNSADKFYIYLGESKGTVAKYGIDTDILVDSSLNGDPADDIDNKGTDSSINGSVFVIKSSDVSVKERTVRINLFDANNEVIATKDIKVIYDFVTGTANETLSGSLNDTLSKDISETDKVNLEKLKDLIRGAKEQDRLKMMQYFTQLQENWFDSREKTKTIIDFEAYVDMSSALDTTTKETFYSLLEGFLLSDSQVKDEIGLATKVLKSLIPKTNSAYTQIMKNIDDIISHPTNTTLNKELGVFILNAIKNDTTIEVKDKNIIKSQLQTIIYGGQNNIPTNAVSVEEETSPGGFFVFIIDFVKILGFVLLGLLCILVAALVYFKMFNKDENLGFQDFIIDKMAGKKPVNNPSIAMDVSRTPPIVPPPVHTPFVEKITEPTDVLASIAPSSVQPVEDNGTSVESSSHTIPEETIPDWLKESTTLSSAGAEISDISSISNQNDNTPILLDSKEKEDIHANTNEDNVNTSHTEDEIPSAPLPDWLSDSVASEKTSREAPVSSTSLEDKTEVMNVEKIETEDDDTSSLPAWMSGIDQDSLQEEVTEEMKNKPLEVNEKMSTHEDIPDWLRSASLGVTEEVRKEEKTQTTQEVVEVPKEKKVKGTKEEKTSKETETKKTVKKEEDMIDDTKKPKEVIPGTHAKKKKPTPVISEGPAISMDPEELPEWLK